MPLPAPLHLTAALLCRRSLPNWGLTGTLPDALDLPKLSSLELSRNQLDGPLPAKLALPALQRLALDANQMTGELPAAWAAGFPQLRELALQGNRLDGTMPPGWLQAAGFAAPFAAAVQPGNEMLCGAIAPAPGHALLYSNGGQQHTISTTLGSCATLEGGCGSATVNRSAPNLYDLAWSNRAAALDLEALNPSAQQNAVPKQGSPVQLPCYPTNAPSYFGSDAAYQKATWQSSTEAARTSYLPVSGNRQPSTADECSMTADAPGYWVVDLQRSTSVLVRGVVVVVVVAGGASCQCGAHHLDAQPAAPGRALPLHRPPPADMPPLPPCLALLRCRRCCCGRGPAR